MNAIELIAALKGADEETAMELVERLQCGEIDCSVLPTGKDNAVQQAQIWAQEARTQKGIVEEIGKLVGCSNDWEMVSAVKAALQSQTAPAVPEGWRTAKDGGHWPHIGGKYLIKLNGVLQHEIYEFDQADDGCGGGEYFWDRDDLDEAAPFNPEKDEWLPIDEAGTATPSVPENEIKAQALEWFADWLKRQSFAHKKRWTSAANEALRCAARLRTAGEEGEGV